MTVPEAPDTTKPDPVLLAVMAALAVAAVVLLAYFIAGTTGLVKQFAKPTVYYKYNVSVIALAAAPCFIFGWLMLPELRCDHRQRLAVAAIIALIATSICTVATAELTPGIARTTDTFAFAAAAYVQFSAFGFLPVLAATRFYVFLNRDTWTERAGDHYLDVSRLSPEAARLVAKHTNNTMKPPPAWRQFMLFGSKDGLTHQDLQRILRLEQAEQEQIAARFRETTRNAEDARSHAYHQHILSLSPKERALFESTLRADVAAVNGFTGYQAKAEAARAAAHAELVRVRDEAPCAGAPY